MKLNLSGLSIAFYLFCGAAIFSEYSYVGQSNSNSATAKMYYKKNGTLVEPHNKVRMASSKKEIAEVTSRMPASVPFSGRIGLNQ